MLIWKKVASALGSGWIAFAILACSDDDGVGLVLRDLGPPCADIGTCGDAGGAADGGDAVDMAPPPSDLPGREDALMTDVGLPPPNGGFDYQIGGDYPPPDGVVTVSRDREGSPAPGLYNICYVNGFQVQPGEIDDWEPDLILRDESGEPIIDPDWDEAILDVSTPGKRLRIAERVGGWIAECGARGFDAIEIDNLDAFTRSGGRLDADHAVALMGLLATEAHRRGLAIGQKNTTELFARRAEMGTDFAISEECSRYDECGEFVGAYGDAVLMIEYRRGDFDRGCAEFGDTHPIVLRDLDVRTPGDGGYVYEGC